ncbi:hypothetical protein ACT7C7_10240 [Bacillus cereus]
MQKGQNLEVVEINHKDGVTDLDVLQSEVDDTVACVIVQYPNFFGQVEKLADIEKIVHQQKIIIYRFFKSIIIRRINTTREIWC